MSGSRSSFWLQLVFGAEDGMGAKFAHNDLVLKFAKEKKGDPLNDSQHEKI